MSCAAAMALPALLFTLLLITGNLSRHVTIHVSFRLLDARGVHAGTFTCDMVPQVLGELGTLYLVRGTNRLRIRMTLGPETHYQLPITNYGELLPIRLSW